MSIDRIYKGLFSNKEVNLKSEVVELGLFQDMGKLMTAGQKEWGAAEGLESKISQLIDDSISAYKQARLKYNEASQVYEKLAAASKELGIDIDPKAKALGERAKAFVGEGEVKIKSLQSKR